MSKATHERKWLGNVHFFLEAAVDAAERYHHSQQSARSSALVTATRICLAAAEVTQDQENNHVCTTCGK